MQLSAQAHILQELKETFQIMDPQSTTLAKQENK
jgi:hypothetical protein